MPDHNLEGTSSAGCSGCMRLLHLRLHCQQEGTLASCALPCLHYFHLPGAVVYLPASRSGESAAKTPFRLHVNMHSFTAGPAGLNRRFSGDKNPKNHEATARFFAQRKDLFCESRNLVLKFNHHHVDKTSQAWNSTRDLPAVGWQR